MSSIELADTSSIAAQMDYAKAVEKAALLPAAYRGKPADILIAIGLGQAMGLSPAESLYRIDVIQGKPTAAAELIAANVRKAGHKLRVQGDETTCTAVIVRADDPDFSFSVTRDLAWAKAMGLDSKDNYRKQPGTMLQWRAITAVARLACPEALYGVAYTADEIADMGPVQPDTERRGLGSALAQQRHVVEVIDGGIEVVDAVVSEPVPSATEPLDTRSKLAHRMFALMGEAGITEKADRLLYCSDVLGREIGSSTDLAVAEAEQIVAALKSDTDNGVVYRILGGTQEVD